MDDFLGGVGGMAIAAPLWLRYRKQQRTLATAISFFIPTILGSIIYGQYATSVSIKYKRGLISLFGYFRNGSSVTLKVANLKKHFQMEILKILFFQISKKILELKEKFE